MKKYKISISLAVGLSEEQPYHSLERKAESAEEIFKEITSKEWFHYTQNYMLKNKNYEAHSFIRVNQISDIYIREVEEGTK